MNFPDYPNVKVGVKKDQWLIRVSPVGRTVVVLQPAPGWQTCLNKQDNVSYKPNNKN